MGVYIQEKSLTGLTSFGLNEPSSLRSGSGLLYAWFWKREHVKAGKREKRY